MCITVPVIKLEMIRGKITIFNILMRMSPGKEITIMTSGGSGDAYLSRIPATEPMITPETDTENHSEHQGTEIRHFNRNNIEPFMKYNNIRIEPL